MTDRVLIVDDEPIIRKGLKGFVEWEKEGLKLEADCANGMEALEILRRQPIDILITDIKMPVMNGLQLTKQALEINPDIKVVLISSYDEFEYVREGMKYGAVDYLLKPSLEADELIAALNRCKELLNQTRRHRVEKNQYQEHALLFERKKYEQEIIRLLASNQTDFSIADIFGTHHESYVCAFVLMDGLNEDQQLHGKLHIRVMYEELQAVFYEEFAQGSAPLLAGDALFMVYPGHEGSPDKRLRSFKNRIKKELAIPITIGYCTEAASKPLEQALRKSRSACMHRFFDGSEKIYTWQHQDDTAAAETGQNELNMYAILEMLRTFKQRTAVMDKLSTRWRSRSLSPEQVKKEAYELLSAFAYSLGNAKTAIEFRDDVLHCETLDQLEATLEALFEDLEHPGVVHLMDKGGHSGQLISRAVEYIRLHYRDEITLQEAADSIHVSKSYFSNLFKKQTGQNFIDYLIDLRLHEAKRLLVIDECKIYEVAERSGFNDVKYFSKLFKKITQMTPMEYRERHQQGHQQ